MSKFYLVNLIFFFYSVSGIWAKNYYVHAEVGNDKNSGTDIHHPFKTLQKLNSVNFKAGDSILLASGFTFYGSLILKNIHGEAGQPVTISSYHSGAPSNSDNKATIDAKGFGNAILVENSSFIAISNLIITANGGRFKITNDKIPNMRCGILVQTNLPGQYQHFRLSNLTIKDIFYEEPGFIRGKEEVKTANGTQHYGWGIRFMNESADATLEDIKITGCTISNTSHTGLKFTAKNYGIRDIEVLNNRITNTGGPGVQMSGVKKGIVRNNTINGSGSSNDSRNWGRGSGLWTWSTADVLIEKNAFLNAKGPGDSAGCHIDYNCNDVVVQYNFSANNAGGFCEILGNNYNCAYRYNISVNDGYRIKGKDGAFQEGKLFWLSGYVGNKKKPQGPYNSYFYNNTIYVKKDLAAQIAISASASGVLIANNIFCIEGKSKLVAGDQFMPEKAGTSGIANYIFKNNLYLSPDNWPETAWLQDSHPYIGNPEYSNPGGLQPEDYIPGNPIAVKDKGIIIPKLPQDNIGLKTGLHVEYDILGNKIQGNPDLGAIELN